jgi:formylglycine-generating enzyme required for sulfatase activity
MRRSTRQAIVVVTLGGLAVASFALWPQIRARRELSRDLAARTEHIRARQWSTPPGMTLVMAGPMIHGHDTDRTTAITTQPASPAGSIPPDETPARSIFIDPFFIDRTEVTNRAYRQAVTAGKVPPPASVASATRTDYFTNPKFDDYPVVNITWDQARCFCESLGKRLPTEAEWEKAARALDNRLWVWGDAWKPDQANTIEAAKQDTVAVALTRGDRTPYAVADLAGNVQEWTADWYSPDYYAQSPSVDPPGPPAGQYRVVRGGSFRTSAWDSRTGKRFFLTPNEANAWTGFRCAQDLMPKWKTDRIKQWGSVQPPPNVLADAPKGRMDLDQRAVDFGQVWAGDPVLHTFRIRNTGSGRLQIKDVQAKCGCTTLGAISGSVPPGGTWELPVRVSTESGEGTVTRAIYLATDDPFQPYVDLYLYGRIREKVEPLPQRNVSFGRLTPTSQPVQVRTLVNRTDDSMTITEVSVLGDWMSVSRRETEPGKRSELRITTRPPLKPGSLTGRVIISLKLGDKDLKATLPVSATVVPRLMLDPEALFVDSPTPKSIVRTVRLIHNEGGTARIVSVTTDYPAVRAEPALDEKGTPTVRIEIPAGTDIPKEGIRLTVRSDDPEFPTLPLTVLLKLKPATAPARTIDTIVPMVPNLKVEDDQ